jgi:hypothetical protein
MAKKCLTLLLAPFSVSNQHQLFETSTTTMTTTTPFTVPISSDTTPTNNPQRTSTANTVGASSESFEEEVVESSGIAQVQMFPASISSPLPLSHFQPMMIEETFTPHPLLISKRSALFFLSIWHNNC